MRAFFVRRIIQELLDFLKILEIKVTLEIRSLLKV